MKRYVVTEGSFSGKPVYVAKDEADAARYLDKIQRERGGSSFERQNSLTLVLTGGSRYEPWRVVAVESWEGDEEPAIVDTRLD